MNEFVKKSHKLTIFKATLTANQMNVLTLMIRSLKKAATDCREEEKRRLNKIGKTLNSDWEPDAESLPSEFNYSLEELSQIFCVTKQGILKTIDKVTNDLMTKVLRYPDKKAKDGWIKEQILSTTKFSEANGLTIAVHKETKSAILDETKGVSFVDLQLFMKVKSAYGKRILDMICKFRDDRLFTLTFDSFCEIVEITPDNYSNGLTGFRLSVLTKPIRQIIKFSNGAWTPTDKKKKGYIIEKKKGIPSQITFTMKYSKCAAQELLTCEQSNEAENSQAVQAVRYDDTENHILKIQPNANRIDSISEMVIYGYLAKKTQMGDTIPAKVYKIIEELRKNKLIHS